MYYTTARTTIYFSSLIKHIRPSYYDKTIKQSKLLMCAIYLFFCIYTCNNNPIVINNIQQIVIILLYILYLYCTKCTKTLYCSLGSLCDTFSSFVIRYFMPHTRNLIKKLWLPWFQYCAAHLSKKQTARQNQSSWPELQDSNQVITLMFCDQRLFRVHVNAKKILWMIIYCFSIALLRCV